MEVQGWAEFSLRNACRNFNTAIMSPQNTRQLAAVMFTDIVGYTAMMQEDETNANKQRDRHRQVLEQRATEFEGRTLHYYGDGAITIFNSALHAVQCAIEIQKELQQPKLPLRIGIHMGDVAFREDGVFGDAVNIASRLEGLAVAGGILISEKIRAEIKNHPEVQTAYVDTFELKNVHEPISIYAISNDGLKVPESKDIKAKTGRQNNRIAVLPFVNMSDELGFDFFGDGLTEELINGLTKMKGLDVTSRTSAFAYKGKNEDIRSIGEKLSVSHILEGSVRKNKDKIRVTAQLIETGDGFHLWSETYERHLKDIFEIQDVLCRNIIGKCRSKLAKHLPDIDGSLYPQNGEQAYERFMEGKFQWNKWTSSSIRKAVKSYKEAIEADPQFLPPYVQLGFSYIYLGITGQMSPRLAFRKAERNIEEALELDRFSASVYAADALIQALFYYEFKEAQRLFDQAFDIDKDNALVCYAYFLFLSVLGKNEQALPWMERALTLDPSSLIYNSELGRAYYYDRQYADALEQFDYTLELDANFLPAIDGKGWIHVVEGDYEAAHEVFEIYQNLVSQEQKNIPQLVYVAARKGMTEVAEHFLEVLQMGHTEDEYTATPVDIALIYLGLKKYDEVFFHLERAVEDRIGALLFIPSNPLWDEIKEDARFTRLVERIGLNKASDNLQAASLQD